MKIQELKNLEDLCTKVIEWLKVPTNERPIILIRDWNPQGKELMTTLPDNRTTPYWLIPQHIFDEYEKFMYPEERFVDIILPDRNYKVVSVKPIDRYLVSLRMKNEKKETA